MKVETKSLSTVKKRLDVHIPKSAVENEVTVAYQDLGKKVCIRGFRQGRVPLHILKGYYGDTVKEQVTAKLIRDSYPGAVNQAGIKPISNPVFEDIDFTEGNDFKYSVIVEIKPDIEVSEYVGIEVVKESPKIEHEDLKKKLENLREAQGYLKSIEDSRPVKEGDFVTVDLETFVNGRLVKGGKTENYQIEIGANKVNQDLEKGLIGAFPGELKEIGVIFPKNFHNPSLAGKQATFKAMVREIKEKILPELDDAFAKDLGDYRSLEDLKTSLREDIKKSEEMRIDAELKHNLLSKLIEQTAFELPEVLVDYEIEKMMTGTKQKLISGDLNISGMDFASLKAEFKTEAEKRVRGRLILEKIAELESIEVHDDDVEKNLKEIAAHLEQDVDTVKEFHIRNNLMDSLKKRILEEKALNFLLEKAKIIEVAK